MKSVSRLFVVFTLALLTGFDTSNHSIPLDEIHSGGPPKDGIPALYDPEFVTADEATFLKPQDRVLGLFINGEAKAYPIWILNWHELVNDRVGGEAVLVSFCPLCGTGMTFEGKVRGERLLFGVSGKLYNSDVLFYDKKTESLWSQIKMEAVTGPMTGQKLKLLATEHTTWAAWQKKHPDTKVLSTRTGYARNYARDPYAGYGSSEQIYFPVANTDKRLFPKAWVVGVVLEGHAKAYAFDRLAKEKRPVQDRLGGKAIVVHYDPEGETAYVEDAQGRLLPSVQAYWFAWAAFYPETELYN